MAKAAPYRAIAINSKGKVPNAGSKLTEITLQERPAVIGSRRPTLSEMAPLKDWSKTKTIEKVANNIPT
jgi:hypothetical protein